MTSLLVHIDVARRNVRARRIVDSRRSLYEDSRVLSKTPTFSGRDMPSVSNDPDECVRCIDGSCDFCDSAYALREPCALQQGMRKATDGLNARSSTSTMLAKIFTMIFTRAM